MNAAVDAVSHAAAKCVCPNIAHFAQHLRDLRQVAMSCAPNHARAPKSLSAQKLLWPRCLRTDSAEAIATQNSSYSLGKSVSGFLLSSHTAWWSSRNSSGSQKPAATAIFRSGSNRRNDLSDVFWRPLPLSSVELLFLLGWTYNILVEGQAQRQQLETFLTAVHKRLVCRTQVKSAFRFPLRRKERM